MYKTRTVKLLKEITNIDNVDFTGLTNNCRVDTFNRVYGNRVDEIVSELINSGDLHRKSEDESNRYREVGNQAYKNRHFKKALNYYTLAICFARYNSTAHALAVSNRSACNYELRSYATCLSDIESYESLTADTPPAVSTRVSERKSKCIDLVMLSQPTVPNYFVLESESDYVKSACAELGITYSESRGRHLTNVSDTTIPPGTLIIKEDPYASVCLTQYKFAYETCSRCYKQLRGGGIPCRGCVFSIYCDNSCRTSDSVHSLECPFSPYLAELNLDRNVYLSLKVILTRIHAKEPTDPQPTDPKTQSRDYNGNAYSSIYNLIYHDGNVSNTEWFTLLKTCHAINCIVNLSITEDLVVHSLSLPCNAHAMYSLTCDYTQSSILTGELQEFGAGAFGLLSMLNHSCDPNVTRVTLLTGTTCVFAIKPIQPGSEVLDNYGVHYATHSLTTRQSHTTEIYNFSCDCTACTLNYPVIDSVPDTPTCDCAHCPFIPQLDEYVSVHESSIESLGANDPVSSVKDAVSCLKYFSHFQSPFKYNNFSQETLKQALFLVASYQFR